MCRRPLCPFLRFIKIYLMKRLTCPICRFSGFTGGKMNFHKCSWKTAAFFVEIIPHCGFRRRLIVCGATLISTLFAAKRHMVGNVWKMQIQPLLCPAGAPLRGIAGHIKIAWDGIPSQAIFLAAILHCPIHKCGHVPGYQNFKVRHL